MPVGDDRSAQRAVEDVRSTAASCQHLNSTCAQMTAKHVKDVLNPSTENPSHGPSTEEASHGPSTEDPSPATLLSNGHAPAVRDAAGDGDEASVSTCKFCSSALLE
ncbi:hypothetical protein FHG87_022313 [Trinorchestia longiramus]|nr:hypothetical protein FHG87_022313 [Trinorchestia longiramus]